MAVPPRALTPELIAALSDAMQRGQIPGFGSAQNDTYPNPDNVDSTHPLNIRYIIPANSQRIVSARLSFHLAPYRTYSNFTATGTGNANVDHSHQIAADAQASSGHSHSHTHGGHQHSTVIGAAGLAQPLTTDGAGNIAGNAGPNAPAPTSTITPTADASAESGHNHNHSHGGTSSGQSTTHTHTVSGSTFSGVVEGATAAGVTLAFDGVDQTTILGGPWSIDVVELNVTPYISVVQGVYHVISLTPSGLGRIEAHLKLAYYANALA